ncbi:MAG TPA: DEAD/DEAH box helicase [Gemmatimonas sp.]|nr:DEAD/DEAH box helicase [Gemmatimonas sp.]
MMAAAMRPALERSRGVGGEAAPACLVVVPTIEQALTAAERARGLLSDVESRVVPVTSAARARRVLATGSVSVVVGLAPDLLALRRGSALRLDGLQTVVVLGLDEIFAEGGSETLQALLGDAPGEIARVVTLEEETPEVEAFLEAQLRRARRIGPPPTSDAPLPVVPSYVITSAAGRAETLRQILDAIDPPSLVIVASSDSSLADATAALHRIGMTSDGVSAHVVRQPTAQHASLVVLWDAPVSGDALVGALASRPVNAITLLLPDELPAFRRMSNNEAAAWTSPSRKEEAESRTRAMQTALRSTLAKSGGASASEMSLLAPLLDTHDALEIAAAALRLYEGARRDTVLLRAKAAAAPVQRAPSTTGARGSLTVVNGGAGAGRAKVFLAVGKRDGARVGDVVGAIANEAGIDGEQIGQVELFESHAIVDLSTEDATRVVDALANVSLRGRKLNARIDDRAGAGSGGFAGRGGERGAGGDRGARGARPMRGGDRGDRRPRPEGGDRGERGGSDRPARSFERTPRAPGEGGFRGPSGPPRSGPPRDGSRDGGRDSRPRGPGGPGGGRPPRADDEKRAFGDRPAQERTEGRSEWSERAARMNNARRTTPRTPPAEPVDEG